MQFIPFENWISVEPAPDLHQDVPLVVAGVEFIKPVSYSRRKAEPNTGRWFRVVEVGDEVPTYLGPGAPVMCNLTYLSDENLKVGDEQVSLIKFSHAAAVRIGNKTMAELGSKHPVLPLGDYVLCVDNDDKHRLIVGTVDEERLARFFEGAPVPEAKHDLVAPLAALERGQRTDEQYEKHVDEDGWETERPNRPNDGVKVMFSEVVGVGPEVPEGRIDVGDMIAFRPNICGIRFDLFGISYRLVRCGKQNPESMGKVPAAVFERMLDRSAGGGCH